LSPGALVDGKYRIIRTLGEGGMGVVYVAEHVFLRKHVALKLLRAELAENEEVLARFEQEARATSLLDHENIVRVTDFGRTPAGELYLVMQLLEGEPLSSQLERTPRLPVDRALTIARQILGGLEAAHAQGIVHRDLKPENVFLCARADGIEHIKLLDFGIAKLRKDAPLKLTTTGAVLGTPQYMAPEQARGLSDIDQRVDVHAAGVMLYEMLAGQAPYRGDNYNVVLFEIMSGQPKPLRELAPDLDPALAEIVMRAFAPDRNRRIQSARELRLALEEWALAPALDHGPTQVDVPARPLVVSLGGTPDPTPGAALVVEPQWEPPLAVEPEPAPPAPELPAHDQFAPPDAGVSELPLEVARPLRTRSVPPASAAVELRPYVDLDQARRAYQGPRRIMRNLLLGLAALLAALLGWQLWNAREPPERTVAAQARANVTLDGLPAQAFVFLDGVRTHLNPIELPISSATHQIRLECLGFQTRTLWFVASGDQVLDARMERGGDDDAPARPRRRP